MVCVDQHHSSAARLGIRRNLNLRRHLHRRRHVHSAHRDSLRGRKNHVERPRHKIRAVEGHRHGRTSRGLCWCVRRKRGRNSGLRLHHGPWCLALVLLRRQAGCAQDAKRPRHSAQATRACEERMRPIAHSPHRLVLRTYASGSTSGSTAPAAGSCPDQRSSRCCGSGCNCPVPKAY